MKYFEDSEAVEYFDEGAYYIHTLDFEALSGNNDDLWGEDPEDDSKALDYETLIKANDPKILRDLRASWDREEYDYSGTVILYRSGPMLVVQDHSSDWYDDHDTLPVMIHPNSLARGLKALDLAAKVE